MTDFLVIFAFVVAGYLLGSANAGVLVSKLVYKDDIRNHGSGNAGTTNMLRTFGKKAALFTLLIDFFKGIVACLLPCLIVYVAANSHRLGALSMMGAACGCVAGHNWPCFFGFKGGKGVLVSFAVMLFIAPLPALCSFGVFLVAVTVSKFVSLGSVLAAAFYPLFVFFIGGWPENTKGLCSFFFVSILLASLIVVRHIPNIKRLFAGTESKLSFKVKDREKNGTPEDAAGTAEETPGTEE